MNVINEQVTLEKKIQQLLNQYSRESKSNTQDFVLAEYLISCLEAYEKAVTWRDRLKGDDYKSTLD